MTSPASAPSNLPPTYSSVPSPSLPACLLATFALTLSLARPAARAQTAAPTAKTPAGPTFSPAAPAAPASPTNAPPKTTGTNDADQRRNFTEATESLKQQIGIASSKVMGRLLQAEGNLELRFSYFDKPERLDPGTFNSKEEIAPWHESLKQLRDAEDLVEKLYGDASTDLENALVSRRVPGPLASRIKQQIADSIPWPVVQRKEKVMGEFIDAHGKLLTFYEENWGHWDTGKPPGPPTFADNDLAIAYQKLHDKITSSGQEIEQLYAKLRQ